MKNTGAGLVATLGWGVEEFESTCKESSKEALLRAREILSEEDPHEPEWIKQRSRYGITHIDKILAKGEHA